MCLSLLFERLEGISRAMLRRCRHLLLFTKPVSATPNGGDYAFRLPRPVQVHSSRQWRRATNGNSDVRHFYRPDENRYMEWYKSTYNLEDVSDGSASSGSSSNRLLDDSLNMQELQQYDCEAMKTELHMWSSEFHHNNQLR